MEIKDPHSADFEELWRIYEEALPEGERKPREAVEGLVTRADYHVMAVKEGERVLAFLMVFVSQHEQVALLEYLATSPQVRNRGLGAAMFGKGVELAGTRPLLVEYDSDREDAPDREMRVRRKNFYLRMGCRQIENLDYLMPQVGDSKPPMMGLAYCWKGCTAPPSREMIRQWLQTVYAEVYQRSRDDAAIEVMMAGFETGNAAA